MRVVDAHEHGLGFRELGQQGQERDPDGERVRGLGVVRERAVEGIGLSVGKARDLADRGPQQLRESGEGSSASVSTPWALSSVMPPLARA